MQGIAHRLRHLSGFEMVKKDGAEQPRNIKISKRHSVKTPDGERREGKAVTVRQEREHWKRGRGTVPNCSIKKR